MHYYYEYSALPVFWYEYKLQLSAKKVKAFFENLFLLLRR